MTSELRAISGAVQFNPVDKELYRTSVGQVLPSLGCLHAPASSSPQRVHDCDMALPPLGHFDFSRYSAVPSFDFKDVAEVLGGRGGGVARGGVRT